MVSFCKKRDAKSGGTAIYLLLFVILLIAAIFGAIFHIGSTIQTQYEHYLEEGRQAVAANDGSSALEAFAKAKAKQSFLLNIYQKLAKLKKSDITVIPADELSELMVSASLMEAYNRFFKLERAAEFVKAAEENLKIMPQQIADEYKSIVATAQAVDKLIELFQAAKYNEVMKELLKVEKNALPTDQDFFITEVRLMIACGKALKEPAILDRARELLFFLAYDLKISNDRIDKLWLLANK